MNASISANLIFFILQHISCGILSITANFAHNIISVVFFGITKTRKKIYRKCTETKIWPAVVEPETEIWPSLVERYWYTSVLLPLSFVWNWINM